MTNIRFYIFNYNPKDIEMTINNIPGVLENGLFVDLTDKVLVGKIENNTPVVYSPSKIANLQILFVLS